MSGQKRITVFYKKNDFNRAIEAELKKRGVQHGQVSIIAIPESLREKWGKTVGIRRAHTA
jgi:hypothetical protein